jgi:hypothetical protein
MNYYFNIKTHEVAMHPPDHWVIGDSTNKPVHIKSENWAYNGKLFIVSTGFIGKDVRFSGFDLEHITEPLVFETTVIINQQVSHRSFWAAYKQASWGHEYQVAKCKLEESRSFGLNFPANSIFREEHLPRLEKELKYLGQKMNKFVNHIGANDIECLTRKSGYVAIADRLPVVLPVSGYECDIERFISL